MKILVVDDEKLARERLVRMVQKLEAHHVVGEAITGRDALQKIQELKPDVVLMDIRMPEMDGLEAARHITRMETPPAVIFCTAYDEHALDAFGAQAVGYLLKPVKSEQLEQALNNAKRLTRVQLSTLRTTAPATAGHKAQPGRRHISARTRLGLELVAIEDVRCLQADHKYVTAYHTHGELLIDDTLKDLEDEFGDCFVRVHRNSLVSLHHVAGMEKAQAGQFAVKLEGIAIKPIVSRRHVAELRKRLREL
jgi:two-component system response regulator AlgR